MASVSKECKKSSTVPGSIGALVIKKGYIEKRQRGRSNPESNTKKKFQRRFVELTKCSLVYYEKENAKDSRGEFSVQSILIVEPVRDNDFHKNYKYFQIGNKQELMYFRVQTEEAREDWINAIRNTAIANGNRMLDKYHLGVYKKGRWSCCSLSLKESDGCSDGRRERTVSMPVKYGHKTCPLGVETATPFPSSLPTFQEPLDDAFDDDDNDDDPQLDEDRIVSFSNSTGSIYSRDSGLGIEGFGKGVTQLRTKDKEDTLKHGGKKHWKQPRKMTDLLEIQYSSSAVNPSNQDKLLQSASQLMDNFVRIGHYNLKSMVKDIVFKGIDQLVIATKHEVHLQSSTSELDASVVFQDPNDEIMSLSSWRNIVAIIRYSNITIVSLDNTKSTATISTEPPCLAGFTPDGSSLIIAGVSTNISYSNESGKLKDISLHTIPLTKLMPGHKPLRLHIHPDPREPYVALLFLDELRNVLCLYIYNYETNIQHGSTICLGATIPSTVPHAVFSQYNLNLFLVYGQIISMVDVTNSCLQQAKLNNFLDELSCVQLTQVGRNIGVVLTSGDVLMFDGEIDHIVQLYKMEISSLTSALAFSVNNKHMAVGLKDGELSLYEKLPPCHPSEVMKMCSIEITRNGKLNVALGHGISVDFPEGFIEEDKIKFNYAITAGFEFGPFKLPNEGRLISGILSLHPEKDVIFKKPISITMPHNLYSETDIIKGVQFCKAKVNDFHTWNGQKFLVFSNVTADDNISHFTRSTQIEGYGDVKELCATLTTPHTCHLCLASDDYFEKQKVSDNSQLFLIQFKPKNLGRSRDFYVDYVMVEFLHHCLQVIKQQYPDSEYTTKKMVFSFRPSHEDLTIKIANLSQLEQDGWKATVDGRDKIFRSDLDFMDIPIPTLRCMCEQKEYPPRFRIKVSAVADDLPKNSEMAVCIGGARRSICKSNDEPSLSVDLLQSDICLPETRKESVSLGEHSCEAQAVQGCLMDMATAIPVSPRKFCLHLFSGYILNHSQVDKLTKLPATTKEDQITEILFQVHFEISRNPLLFASLCEVLTKMECHSICTKLKDAFKRIQAASQQYGTSGSIQQRPMYSSTV